MNEDKNNQKKKISQQLFKLRNNLKINLDSSTRNVFFKERDVFFISIGKNIGYEQNGKGKDFARPVVIIKKFNNTVFWGVPLTSKEKSGKYYFSFKAAGKNQYAILSQIRLFDKNRLLKKIGVISNKDFILLKKKIKSLL